MALTTDNWVGTASADWGVSGANWSAGFPDAGDNVVISTASVLTVSYSGSDTSTIHALAVGEDLFAMSGGSLTVTTTASFADGFMQTGGVFSAGDKVAVKGAATLTGGSAEGKTDFVLDGTVSLANYTLGGSSALTNAGITDLTGNITLGDTNGTGARIDNEKGGVFAIGGDFGIALGAQTAEFINAGTLEITAGTGTSIIGVSLDESGRIVVGSGTLDCAGPDNSFAGAISGAGQFALGAGNAASTDTIARGATISTGTFDIYNNGTFVTLDETLSYAGNFNLEDTSTLSLDGVTFTLSGTASFNSEGWPAPTIDGSGLLITARGSTTDVNVFTLGGTVIWLNSGTVSETDTLQLSDASGNSAAFVNEKGGVYAFTTDSGIAIGAAANSSFVNSAGATLEKTGGTGISTVAVDYSGGGRIVIDTTGTIDFAGADNSFAGAVSGDGQFALGADNAISNDTILQGATITTGTFDIYDNNTFVALDEKLSYAGNFNLLDESILDLDGVTFTLSGTATFNSEGWPAPIIDGAGTLVTTHASNTSIDNFILGGSVDWQNFGKVAELGPLTIGDTGFDAAVFTNEKGGVYDFVGDNGIGIGLDPGSAFVNLAGATLEKTAGTGDSQILVEFTNDGTVKVATGEIEFAQAVGGSGSFAIAAGATLRFDAGAAKDLSIDFTSTRGGELVLADAPQFAAAIHGFGGGDQIDLGDINFASVKLGYSGNAKEGVLTVTDGSDTAELMLFGDYKLADFHASADASGGTLIVDRATHALFASAR